MRNIKYIIIIGLMVISSACKKDFVYLTNPNQQTSGSFWKTADDAQAGTDAIYQAMYYDGMYKRLYLWLMDVRADDVINTSPWWINDLSIYKATIDNPCYIATWEAAYKGIWRANQVLDNVPGINMDSNLKKILLAQAKFMRALYYYHLEIVWKNIPLILKTPQNADDFTPKQATPDAVWAQIISDFTDAMNDLPVNDFTGKAGGYAASDAGRATKGAAAGFLARSYIYTKQWAKAAPILKDIIDQKLGTYSLLANYRENFTIANPNNSESLFEIQFNSTLGGNNLDDTWSGEPAADNTKTGGYARGIAPLPGFGYGDVSPSNWIYEEFLLEKTIDGKPDPRLEASLFYQHFLKDSKGNDSLDINSKTISDTTYKVYGKTWAKANLTLRTDYAVHQIYNVHIRKYLNDETDKDETLWRSGIHQRILRFSDILLLYAEAQNELGNTADAYTYIQKVRDRAKLLDLATVKPGLTQDGMRAQIRHERALELCFEAQRYVDLLRWGVFEPGNETLLAEIQGHDPELLKWTSGREILAIRQDELNANKNLVQNPGW